MTKRLSPTTATLLPQKKGKEICLMPSDPNALVEMLTLRFASYKAGDTDVMKDIVDTSDELPRQNLLDKILFKNLMLQL